MIDQLARFDLRSAWLKLAPWLGLPQPIVSTRLSLARLGSAHAQFGSDRLGLGRWLGLAWLGSTWFDPTWPGSAWLGSTQVRLGLGSGWIGSGLGRRHVSHWFLGSARLDWLDSTRRGSARLASGRRLGLTWLGSA